jgi:Flp pilus assembly protein TadD
VRNLFRRRNAWREYFDEGMKRGEASDFSGAEASFREAVRLAPEEAYPHYELGYTLALVGRHEEALEEFRLAQQLARAFFIVETEICVCEQVLNGSLDEAVVGMLRQLQWIVDSGGFQSADAAALSTKVIESSPECALGHFHFGKAMFERDPVAAEESLRRCIELSPDDTTAINAKFHLGVLRERAGREDEARSIWRGIVSDYPGHLHATFAKGR